MKKYLLLFVFFALTQLSLQAQVQLSAPAKDSLNAPTSIELAWIHQSAALNYKIEIDTTANFNTVRCRKIEYTGNVTTLANATIATHLFKNLLHNTEYFWRVQMMSISDTSFSEIRNFTTTNTVKVISPLNNASGVSRDAYFEYYSRFNTATYRYQVGTSTTTILTNPLYDDIVVCYIPYGLDNYAESFTLPSSLDPFSSYCWRIREENDSSVSAWTEIMQFTTSDKTMKMSNDVLEHTSQQQIFPNPSNGLLNYTLNFLPTKVVFYDNKGAAVRFEMCTSSSGYFDIHDFAKGFYTAQFTSISGEEIQLKFVVAQ